MERVFLVFISFGIFVFGCASNRSSQQPNIIFIVADDIGWNDLGCYGNKAIKTPNIDDLANKGLKFTNVYLTTSSCSPSRASILTGRYPHNTGAAELHTPLLKDLTLFPEQLRRSGYYTGAVGKWGWEEDAITHNTFDTLLTGKITGSGGEKQWINVLKNRPKDKPFFFWFAAHDAHRPFRANQFNKTLNSQSKMVIPPTLVDTRETRRDLKDYYNEIGRLDYYVGKVVEELKKEKIVNNTIIIFISDNGRPFPGSKTRINDRGVRTPFIIKWPKYIRPNSVCNSLVSSIDIAPTLLELAGVKPPSSIQGASFTGLLNHPDSAFRTYVFAEHNWHDYEAYERMVRTEKFLYLINLRPALPAVGCKDVVISPSFKALKRARNAKRISPLQNDIFVTPRPEEEFYDCSKDPKQVHNLIGNKSYKNEIMWLRNVLKRWQKETGDTEPNSLTPDWYDRMTGKPLQTRGSRGEMPGETKRADTIDVKGPF